MAWSQATDSDPDPGGVMVSLVTNPDPPRSVQVELIASVTDAHGRYAITAEFVHGGNWRVTVQVNQDGVNVALEDFELAVRKIDLASVADSSYLLLVITLSIGPLA
jgi:hypothetical protein